MYSNESTPNFALSLNIPPQKLFGWFRRPQLWAPGDWQLHHDNTPSHASHLLQFFDETSNHPSDSAPYNPDLAPCNFWLFPKLKSSLKGKRFENVNKIQENMKGQVMAIGRTMWGPKVSTFKGTEASLFYVQFFLYLVSFSISVSIFHITWLDTFWTDLIVNNLDLRDHIQITIENAFSLYWLPWNNN